MLGSLGLPAIVVLAAVLVAAVTDVWKFRVYNALTLPLMATGVLYHAYQSDVGNSLLGILFGFVALIPLYITGGMGGGDVKLMAAVGAWLGLPLTFYVFLASSLAAGAYALGLVIWNGRFHETLIQLHILWLRLASVGRYLGAEDRMEQEVNRADRRTRIIPFAAMMAVGLVATLIWLRQAPLP